MAEGIPSPKAILRGHKAQIHAATFIRHNERLLTGDAEGWVVAWDLTIMRARAVWRAHENSILGIKGWGKDKIITHGRDHKLIVWRLTEADEDRMSVSLPLDDLTKPRPQPWVLHLLDVNTMNFCCFAACSSNSKDASLEAADSTSDITVAVPNTLASEAIDLYALPSQTRVHTVKPGQGNGMAMSLALLHHQDSLVLVAAFENGFASVHRLQLDGTWAMTYRSQAHSQPILSIDVHPNLNSFFTSSADSIIAKHPIPEALQEIAPSFDPMQRVVEEIEEPETTPSLLSQALKDSGMAGRSKSNHQKAWEHPLKAVNTKHSGQQSLKIRSDGRIFATAGWDSKIRVYSAKTLKEVAILQWHKVGAYAVAFASVDDTDGYSGTEKAASANSGAQRSIKPSFVDSNSPSTVVRLAPTDSMTVKDRRIRQAKSAHWIAAGAKDGKVSLWDIY